MRKFITPVALLLCLAASSRAEQIWVRHVSELVKPSVLIARVKILAIQPTGNTEGYTKIAYAQVQDAILGTTVGSIFLLENDQAHVVCPHVSYEVGEDVLVFAKSTPSGNYQTVYADAGKFLIKDETMDKNPFEMGQSYRSAVTEIKRAIKKIGKPQD
jgi:hypothetical protein